MTNNNDTLVSLKDIDDANALIKDQILRTPTIHAFSLSKKYGCNIFLKLENLQATNSFKVRGALNKLLSLSDEEKSNGVVACSAGNHAQGVAYHAKSLGIKATIIMPKATPLKKVSNTEQYGATVILYGDTFNDAYLHSLEFAKKEQATLIHPFDDEHIIAGQGTIALEILEDHDHFDNIIVPIGGGGLISGISTAVKSLDKQKTTITGVQSVNFPAHYNYFYGTNLPTEKNSIAEGIAVKSKGELTKAHILEYVDEIKLAEEELIEQAIYDFCNEEKLVVEGAAAASLVQIMKEPEAFKDKKVCLIICGGNIDQSLLTTVLTRGMMNNYLYTTLRFESDDRPGFLNSISSVLSDENINIVEVKHNRLFKTLPIKKAHIDITLETRGKTHAQELLSLFSGKGFKVKVINSGL